MQLFEKYGTLIERYTALIEKVSALIGLHATGFTECAHASGSAHGDVNHPHNAWRVTVFPAPMTTASSFSRELGLEIGRAIGRESRAKHNNITGGTLSWAGESSLYCMAPMINVCQDVRWGRCQEGELVRRPLSADGMIVYVCCVLIP
eukprot:SAG31_NODE_13083_length_894_cov_0.943396_3_plen_148_part_00